MTHPRFAKWFQGSPKKSDHRRPQTPLSVQLLESRLVPASTIGLLSVAIDGSSGDNASGLGASQSAVSQNGRYVVFESSATDLVVGQTELNAGTDIFLRDRQTNTTILVSHESGSPAVTGDNISRNPSISADGRYVVYRSTATDLVSGQVDGSNNDVFLYDTATDTTTLVSHADGAATTASNNSTSYAQISADGNYVVFVSRATNLLANQSTFDTNATDDVFLWSRATGTRLW